MYINSLKLHHNSKRQSHFIEGELRHADSSEASKLVSDDVYVSQLGLPSKIPQTGALKQQEFLFPEPWRIKV